jgi:predicted RNA binding protein YcfA (HicA-like mRNA interferase family)
MKLPRNLSGAELIKKLKKLGYEPTRQLGSHIRITTEEKGINHITIPAHKPLKVGTLSAILKDIAIILKSPEKNLWRSSFNL